MAKYQLLKINGVTIDNARAQIRFVDESFSETVNGFEIVLSPKVKDDIAFNLQNYQTVEIWEGDITATDTQVMDGYINEIEDNPSKITIRGGDKLLAMTFEQINKIYISATDPTAGVVSAIIGDLFTYCGIDWDSTTVQDSTAVEGGIIPEFVCRDTDPLERAMALADRVGYQLYYNSNTKKGHFHSKGYNTNTNTIYIGGPSANTVNIPQWTFDGKDMFNYLKIEGVLDIYQQPDQTFSGDGSTKVFTLTGKTAEFVKVSISGTTKTGGKEGSSSTYDYTFNKESNQITFITAPASASNNVVVTPFVGEPTPVEIDDVASILKYQLTIKKKMTLTDVKSVADAESRGKKILDGFKEEFTSCKVLMKPSVMQTLGAEAGQMITVQDYYNSKIGTRQVMIRAIRRYYPERPLEVELGDRDWKILDSGYDKEIRLKRLEEQQAGTQDIITIIKRPDFTMTPTIQEVQTTTWYICDCPYTNHPVNGWTDEGHILDSFENTVTSRWSSGTLTLTANTVDPIHLAQMLKLAWTTSAANKITSTQSFGNLSTHAGIGSGTPIQGMIGLWLKVNNASDITAVKLRIGSDSSNYALYSAKVYNSNITYEDINFTLMTDKNYLLFDLNSPDSVTGTPNWTAVAWTEIEFTTVGTGNASIDLFSISKSNYIAATPMSDTAFKRMIQYTNNVF